MKYLLIIISIFMLSCEQPNVTTNQTNMRYCPSSGSKDHGIVVIYKFGSCQYIGSLRGLDTDWCTHKGDCNNPIHRY